MATQVFELQLTMVERPAEYEEAVTAKENARNDIDLATTERQQALTQASTTGKLAGVQSDGASEVMRLKAQVVTLNDRITQMSANLATTSESVIRGNKALTTERAQFHAKYASLTKKLEATQAALAEAEALPKDCLLYTSDAADD